MRSSSKSRSRNKNRSSRSNLGNVVNRVFDSSGPEGKVRGTPQQIIEKYQTLSRDAQLSGDRVAAENFLQHAEHYVRMLGEAQREMDQRRDQQESQRQNQQSNNQNNQPAQNSQNNQQNNQPNNQQNNQQPSQNSQPQDKKPAQHPAPVDASGEQPTIPETADLFPGQDDSNLVETPESKPAKPVKKAAPRKRPPAKPKAKPVSDTPESAVDAAPALAETADTKAAE